MKVKKQREPEIATNADWIRQWTPITLILILATVLYLYQLGSESLWTDEILSIKSARKLELINFVGNGRVFYFILLRLWMLFGTSDTWLRGLSVLFGLGSIFLTYWLGRRLVGEATALIAAFLLSLSPLFINHVQEVRMYGMGTFLGLVGTLFLAHALKRPTASSMNGWASTRILMLMTAPLNSALLLSDVVLFWLRFRNQRHLLFSFGKRLLLVGILQIPALYKIIKSAYAIGYINIDKSPNFNIVNAPYKLIAFTTYYPGNQLPLNTGWLHGACTVMLAYLIGIALLKRRRSEQLVWIAVWAFLPITTFFLGSYFAPYLWLRDRYLLFASPYIFILLAAGFLQVWNRGRILAVLIALVYTITVSSALAAYYTVQDRSDWRGVAQVIRINEESKDIVALYPDLARLGLTHYYHGSASIEVMENSSRKFDQSAAEKMLRSLSQIKSLRFWLVIRGSEEQHQIFRTVVREYFNIQKHQRFTGIDVFLVTPRCLPKLPPKSGSHSTDSAIKPCVK